MDEKGYTFTPLTVLLFIPIMIVAISYGNIVSEANMLANLAIGGDVTVTIASSILTNIEKGANDGGRNSAYNATRSVIDNSSVNSTTSPFFANGTSRNYVLQKTIASINTQVISSAVKLEKQTGREVYVNNIPVTNYTTALFNNNSVFITQTDPFGFYVNINGGIPIKIVQKGQVYQTSTPTIKTYVSLQGLEDPYIWVNTKFRISDVINSYPYYTTNNYHFQEKVDNVTPSLDYLFVCLNGTNNPNGITPRPYYFPDSRGLSFFDRLENRSVSADNNSTRMSTFVLNDVLNEEHNSSAVSIVDWEYFKGVPGSPITIGGKTMKEPYPYNSVVIYLSTSSKGNFSISY